MKKLKNWGGGDFYNLIPSTQLPLFSIFALSNIKIWSICEVKIGYIYGFLFLLFYLKETLIYQTWYRTWSQGMNLQEHLRGGGSRAQVRDSRPLSYLSP